MGNEVPAQVCVCLEAPVLYVMMNWHCDFCWSPVFGCQSQLHNFSEFLKLFSRLVFPCRNPIVISLWSCSILMEICLVCSFAYYAEQIPRKDMVGGMFKTAVVREIEEDKQEVEAIVSNGLFYHCVVFL